MQTDKWLKHDQEENKRICLFFDSGKQKYLSNVNFTLTKWLQFFWTAFRAANGRWIRRCRDRDRSCRRPLATGALRSSTSASSHHRSHIFCYKTFCCCFPSHSLSLSLSYWLPLSIKHTHSPTMTHTHNHTIISAMNTHTHPHIQHFSSKRSMHAIESVCVQDRGSRT